MKKRILAMLMIVAMLAAVCMVSALADEPPAPPAGEPGAGGPPPAEPAPEVYEAEPDAIPEDLLIAPAPAAAATFTVKFSVAGAADVQLAAGEDLVFYISCDAPVDLGPDPAVSCDCPDAVISYSEVTLGGPMQYPTAELVTISGITGDCLVTIAYDNSVADQPPAIIMGEAEIAEALAFAAEMAAQMAANPMPADGPEGVPADAPAADVAPAAPMAPPAGDPAGAPPAGGAPAGGAPAGGPGGPGGPAGPATGSSIAVLAAFVACLMGAVVVVSKKKVA